jgi:hypothetical protein
VTTSGRFAVVANSLASKPIQLTDLNELFSLYPTVDDAITGVRRAPCNPQRTSTQKLPLTIGRLWPVCFCSRDKITQPPNGQLIHEIHETRYDWPLGGHAAAHASSLSTGQVLTIRSAGTPASNAR